MNGGEASAADDLIIVLGPSVAGAETLPTLVNSLPPETAAPIIVALPLDITRIVNLASVLGRYTPLTIRAVTDAVMLTAGSIFIVPAHRKVTLAAGRLVIANGRNEEAEPSVATLLMDATDTYGDRLIIVLLAGTGAAVIASAIESKNAGGTIIVQTQQGLRYPPALPPISPLLIDSQVEIQQIGPLLHALVVDAKALPVTSDAEDDLQTILTHVSQHASIDFRLYKTTTIIRRIGRRMAVTHCQTMHAYSQYLRVHGHEANELVKSLLINVTQFFRDPEAFAFLRDAVLPSILETARQRDHILRFWSAGCATGEESYSLAMLVSDMLGDELAEWTIKIFATDVDEAAISYGRHGVYSEPLLRSVPDDYRERFFDQVEDGYRVNKALRQMVIFGQQDLSRSAPFPRIDLLLCRNVLIYFTAELQDYVLSQFGFSLNSYRGYLFLGKAETVRTNHTYFEVVDKRWRVFQCSGGVPILPRRIASLERGTARLPAPTNHAPTLTNRPGHDSETTHSRLEVSELRTYNDLLLRYLPTGVVVIDRGYRLLTTNVTARRLLGLRDSASEQDFLHAVHGIPYAEVRTAIDTVFRERRPMYLGDVALNSSKRGGGPYLALSIVPMQIAGTASDLALINVIDVTEQVQSHIQIEAAQTKQGELISELDTANRRLSELNQELLDANEELQVTNEEMVLTHEELQASIEEFEATNEELQATNEELETNNEELQATNEELQTTNDELRARTNELQDLSLMVEAERTRFADMVELAPFSIIALRGPSLQVQAVNPRYARLLHDRQVYGRPLAEVFELFWLNDSSVIDVAYEVYRHGVSRTLLPKVVTVPGEGDRLDERMLVYTLVPTHNAIGSVDGVIIYAEDMTEERAREAEEERERLEVIFDNAQQVALGLYDVTTQRLIAATGRYLDVIAQLHDVERDEIVGHRWDEQPFVPHEQATIWREVITAGKRLRLPPTQTMLNGDDHATIWDSSIIPIPLAEQLGEIQFVLVSAVEITEQVRAREELERLDHLKDEFLSLASHELRTPLTPLMGYAEMVTQILKQQPINDPAEQRRINRFTAQFTKQIDRLNRLVGDLVDVGRLQNGTWTLQREPLDLLDVVTQAVTEACDVHPERTITIDAPPSDAPLQFIGDAVRLHQVMSNLLSNALTYAPNSPTVHVRLHRLSGQPGENDLAEIEVQDYGPGIPAAFQALLFDRFFQIERTDRPARGGLGLGLYIVRQIVEQHNGSITVLSQEGKGSLFRIRLPLANEQDTL